VVLKPAIKPAIKKQFLEEQEDSDVNPHQRAFKAVKIKKINMPKQPSFQDLSNINKPPPMESPVSFRMQSDIPSEFTFPKSAPVQLQQPAPQQQPVPQQQPAPPQQPAPQQPVQQKS
jgi:hypothetical protein